MLSTITSKGQITIPKKVRERLGLKAGDKVELILVGNDEVSLKVVRKNVDEVYGILSDSGHKSHTVDQMKQAIAKKIIEKYSDASA